MQPTFHDDLNHLTTTQLGRHQQLAFICSVLSPAHAADRTIQVVDWECLHWGEIFSLVTNHLIAPLFYQCIKQKQLESYCPDDFLEALLVIWQANKERNARQKEILVETIKLLNTIDIIPRLLKGAHALVGALPNAQARMLSDIDLLVPAERIKEAESILLKNGFYQKEQKDHCSIEAAHHLSPIYHATSEGYIELHRRVNYSDCSATLMPLCFDAPVMQFQQTDDLSYFVNHPWQLLLYNQIHHYYSYIVRTGTLDLRQLSEQAFLYDTIRNDNFLWERVAVLDREKNQIAQIQFSLIQQLFDLQIDSRLTELNKNARADYRYSLGQLVLNQEALAERRWRSWCSLPRYCVKRLTDPRWLQERLIQPNWYKSRVKIWRHLLNQQIVFK